MEINNIGNIRTYTTDDSIEDIYVCGDIHGEFESIVYKIKQQCGIKNALVIIAGDCGFGFYKKGYYENLYPKIERRLEENNITIAMVRGNHDNPAYFIDDTINFKRFFTMPDYSVIKMRERTILCIGGAISIDRIPRINRDMLDNPPKGDFFAPRCYWEDEAPLFKPTLLNDICDNFEIDTVVTHTCPSFCEKIRKNGLESWALRDENLYTDIDAERHVMDEILRVLTERKQPLRDWIYGHYHASWSAYINNVCYRMLNIDELYMLPPNGDS